MVGEDGTTGLDLVKHAESALEESKHRGKNTVSFFSSAMSEEKLRRLELSDRLQASVVDGMRGFSVHYQPLVDAGTLGIAGAEALVRWKKPDGTLIRPGEFIPLFEKNGFIVELDFYVLEATCRILKQSLEISPERTVVLSVNVSRVTLFQNDFIKRFVQMAERYGVPPKYLEIEITENVFIFDANTVEQILSQLRSYGFSISMDDFGSGYSSLNLLRELPIDVLKIDRIFLQESIRVEKAYAIIKSVVEMAHSLNMVVVCEGVETLEHAEFLKTIHCAVGQGYYFSKPIPLSAFQKKYNLLPTQKHPEH